MEKSCDGMSIHNAASSGSRAVCADLLEEGVDVDSTDALGWTPLMHAVHNGHTGLAENLLSRGAAVSQCSHHGITAFTTAILEFDEHLQRLLYNRLSPELKQEESNMALLVACANGSLSAVKWLLQNTLAQADFMSPLIGVTPLMLVSMTSGDCEIAEILLNSGADPNIKNPLRQDAAELALATGNNKLYLLLNNTSSKAEDYCIKGIVKNTNPDFMSSLFMTDELNLDVEEVGLKKSPICSPYRADSENLSTENDKTKCLLSPSKRSVFLPSPLRRSPNNWESEGLNRVNHRYDLAAIVTPRKFVAKAPSYGKKRKLSTVNGISSWFKKMTKRRSKSLEDEDDYEDLSIRQPNGVDFLKVLKGLELEEFFPVFKDQELDIWTFLSLTVGDLAAMGIVKASSQLRILAGIQTLRTTQI